MTLPKKVYIDNFGSGFSHGWHTEHSYKKDIEYTRTDAFIDKACEWLANTDFCHYYNKEFIDNFRKAMEE